MCCKKSEQVSLAALRQPSWLRPLTGGRWTGLTGGEMERQGTDRGGGWWICQDGAVSLPVGVPVWCGVPCWAVGSPGLFLIKKLHHPFRPRKKSKRTPGPNMGRREALGHFRSFFPTSMMCSDEAEMPTAS